MPLLLLLIFKGSYLLFTAFIALVSFIGLMEYGKMVLPGRVIPCVVVPLAGSIFPFLFYLRSAALTVFAVTFTLLALSIYLLFSFRDVRSAASEAALLFFGVLYIPYLLGYLVLLRNHPQGVGWIMVLLLIVMSGDSAAYFIGCSFGRHKLYPSVSPNKSIEGALAGLGGSVVGALLGNYLFLQGVSAFAVIIAALLVGTLGQVGDLFESLLKRSFGVKDSGTIIPGHGGILDRLDSILYAAPAAYYYVLYVAGRLSF